MTVVLQLQRHA